MLIQYHQLAFLLDQIPNGYPKTDSGVELKILEKLFTPEDLEFACTLTAEPQSSKTIAARLKKDERQTLRALISMVKRGLIGLKREQGEMLFNLIPFVVGFYEMQNAQIDEEFAQLFEQYYKEAFHQMTMLEPSVHRVIPVEQTIPVGIDVMPYEKASTYIDNAKSWGVLNCICRVQKKLIGEGCNHSVENCITISKRENAYDKVDAIKTISKEEAFLILAAANEEGLVHSTSNTQDDVTYICNCCTCSCGILRSIAEYGSNTSVASSDFYVTIDEDICNGCEVCIDRCQFNALSMVDGISNVNTSICYGCGLCITTCTENAISLKQKDILIKPPLSESEWNSQRLISRKML